MGVRRAHLLRPERRPCRVALVPRRTAEDAWATVHDRALGRRPRHRARSLWCSTSSTNQGSSSSADAGSRRPSSSMPRCSSPMTITDNQNESAGWRSAKSITPGSAREPFRGSDTTLVSRRNSFTAPRRVPSRPSVRSRCRRRHRALRADARSAHQAPTQHEGFADAPPQRTSRAQPHAPSDEQPDPGSGCEQSTDSRSQRQHLSLGGG